jgi:hypothetical protein
MPCLEALVRPGGDHRRKWLMGIPHGMLPPMPPLTNLPPGQRSRPPLLILHKQPDPSPSLAQAISGKQANPDGAPGPRGFTCYSPALSGGTGEQRGRGSLDPLCTAHEDRPGPRRV